MDDEQLFPSYLYGRPMTEMAFNPQRSDQQEKSRPAKSQCAAVACPARALLVRIAVGRAVAHRLALAR